MMKFLSIGSGSSGNCYLLRSGETGILIDVGVNIRTFKKHLKDYGISLENDIQAVFITHDHADHIKAVGNLATEYAKPIYATELVHKGIARNHSVTAKVPVERMKIISKGEPVEIGPFRITPFDVPHDSRDCVGYAVDVEGMRFCLITDAGHVTTTIQENVNQANYLVLEANHDPIMLKNGPYAPFLKDRISSDIGHLSNEEAGHLLAEHATPQLQHVWLCHLSEENNHPELAKKTIETILRDHGIIPGIDFEMTILKRKSPSEEYTLT